MSKFKEWLESDSPTAKYLLAGGAVKYKSLKNISGCYHYDIMLYCVTGSNGTRLRKRFRNEN